ncbi:MAG: AbrB/MazE/SpoVT family DNA-binding domain-containing protein, partial [Acidimicrobiia bacterium]
MRTTIDGAGRIVVPKALRDSLNLTGGTEVELVEHDGTL